MLLSTKHSNWIVLYSCAKQATFNIIFHVLYGNRLIDIASYVPYSSRGEYYHWIVWKAKLKIDLSLFYLRNEIWYTLTLKKECTRPIIYSNFSIEHFYFLLPSERVDDKDVGANCSCIVLYFTPTKLNNAWEMIHLLTLFQYFNSWCDAKYRAILEMPMILYHLICIINAGSYITLCFHPKPPSTGHPKHHIILTEE